MKNFFPKSQYLIPKWFILDATNKSLGRFINFVCKLLQGKYSNCFFSNIDQANYIIILNSSKIKVSNYTYFFKKYYNSTKKPGSLKYILYKNLITKHSTKILFEAIKGMLPKKRLGKKIYKRIFIFDSTNILYNDNINI